MSDTISVSGIVLSAGPMGENDKRMVLLTRELGKISVFSRGARRPASTLMAASNPFVIGSFTLIQGKNSYTLISVQVMNYFIELAGELPGVYYGFYFLEFASYYGRENLDATDMLNLLYLTIKALLNPKIDDRLVRRIYELRLMTINGEYAPQDQGGSESLGFTCSYIATAPLQKLYTFEVTEEVLEELEDHLDRWRDRIVDRRFRSLEILKSFL